MFKVSAVASAANVILPLIVSTAPLSMLLLMVWPFAPAALVTLALMVMLFVPPNTSVVLFARVIPLLVVNAPPAAKMPPLLITIAPAEPMPFAVNPSMPPLALMLPVKVLAEDGFRLQTPPSALVIVSTFAPPLVRTEAIWLSSVLRPRSSNVTAPVAEFVIFESWRAPLPDESMRIVEAPEVMLNGRLAVSPEPTYTRLTVPV